MEIATPKGLERIVILIVCSVDYEDSLINLDGEMVTPLKVRLELEELIARSKC